jgi:hypothetical protein
LRAVLGTGESENRGHGGDRQGNGQRDLGHDALSSTAQRAAGSLRPSRAIYARCSHSSRHAGVLDHSCWLLPGTFPIRRIWGLGSRCALLGLRMTQGVGIRSNMDQVVSKSIDTLGLVAKSQPMAQPSRHLGGRKSAAAAGAATDQRLERRPMP